MSALPEYPKRKSEAEYLAFERESNIKHEYMDGEIFAMAGASRSHNLISVNIITALRNQARTKGCTVYPSDMRIRIEALADYAYPDVSVLCGDSQFAEDVFDSLLNPSLIIEVLSPSTEKYDRGKKFQKYRKIDTLREYLLVSQDSPRIERYLLNDNQKWELTDAIGLETTLELPSIGCELNLREVYDLVDFPLEKDQ